MDSCVKVNGLSFGYGERKILEKICFEVGNGKFFGILGPNGSGKSTLLKNIMQYISPDSGTVFLFEEEISNMSRNSIAKKMAFVPQKSEMSMGLSVFETILMGRLPHLKNRWEGYTQTDRSIVESAMLDLDLTRFKDRIALSLSGGEFQKVLLARALVQAPEVVLLDEPTSNLDMNHAVELMSLIKNMTVRNELTAVAVLHDLNLASLFCDEVIFIKDNGIKYSGNPKSIFKREIIREVYGVDVFIGFCDEGFPYVVPKIPGNDNSCFKMKKCI